MNFNFENSGKTLQMGKLIKILTEPLSWKFWLLVHGDPSWTFSDFVTHNIHPGLPSTKKSENFQLGNPGRIVLVGFIAGCLYLTS